MCGEERGQDDRWRKSRLARSQPQAVTIELNTGFSYEAPYRTGGRVLLLQRPPFFSGNIPIALQVGRRRTAVWTEP
jgi:hypothetical protein